MKNTSIRFVSYSIFISIGVVLMLLGETWLLFPGLAFFSVASFFSAREQVDVRGRIGALVFYLACTTFFFVDDYRDGLAFTPKMRPLWLWIAFAGVGLWCIAREFMRWQKTRRLT